MRIHFNFSFWANNNHNGVVHSHIFLSTIEYCNEIIENTYGRTIRAHSCFHFVFFFFLVVFVVSKFKFWKERERKKKFNIIKRHNAERGKEREGERVELVPRIAFSSLLLHFSVLLSLPALSLSCQKDPDSLVYMRVSLSHFYVVCLPSSHFFFSFLYFSSLVWCKFFCCVCCASRRGFFNFLSLLFPLLDFASALCPLVCIFYLSPQYPFSLSLCNILYFFSRYWMRVWLYWFVQRSTRLTDGRNTNTGTQKKEWGETESLARSLFLVPLTNSLLFPFLSFSLSHWLEFLLLFTLAALALQVSLIFLLSLCSLFSPSSITSLSSCFSKCCCVFFDQTTTNRESQVWFLLCLLSFFSLTHTHTFSLSNFSNNNKCLLLAL